MIDDDDYDPNMSEHTGARGSQVYDENYNSSEEKLDIGEEEDLDELEGWLCSYCKRVL